MVLFDMLSAHAVRRIGLGGKEPNTVGRKKKFGIFFFFFFFKKFSKKITCSAARTLSTVCGRAEPRQLELQNFGLREEPDRGRRCLEGKKWPARRRGGVVLFHMLSAHAV